jgi:hypothetical protein
MKGVIAAAVSVALFRNQVTPKGCLGYAVTVAGVFLYSESKRRARVVKAADAARDVRLEEGQPLMPVKAHGGSSGGAATAGGIGIGFGGGGPAAVQLVARASSGCGGAAPTGAQQVQQHHRTSRASGVGGGGGGGVPGGMAVAVN